MTLPLSLGTIPLPDWLPWWVPALVLIPLLVYGLLVLAVPFSVFGTKSRLEAIEAQLDDIHAEIRSLTLRLPAPIGEVLPPVRPRALDDEEEERATRLRSGGVYRPDGRPVVVRPPVSREEPRFGPR